MFMHFYLSTVSFDVNPKVEGFKVFKQTNDIFRLSKARLLFGKET